MYCPDGEPSSVCLLKARRAPSSEAQVSLPLLFDIVCTCMWNSSLHVSPVAYLYIFLVIFIDPNTRLRSMCGPGYQRKVEQEYVFLRGS